jgi:hypothetical protein
VRASFSARLYRSNVRNVEISANEKGHE